MKNGSGEGSSKVDAGVMDGDTRIIALNSDGDGLLGILEVGLAPYAEGDKSGIQLGSMFHLIIDT